jgi:hypothetical protein
MFYELWDVQSGNIINTYETEEQALVVVRGLLDLNGTDYARALSLSFEDDNEDTTVIAEGMALAARAGAAAV